MASFEDIFAAHGFSGPVNAPVKGANRYAQIMQSQANDQAKAAPKVQPKRNLGVSLLPAAGAIGAGLLAAPFTAGLSLPAAIALAGGTAFIGATAGEAGAQKLNNEKYSGAFGLDSGKILKEGALSAALGAAGAGVQGARGVKAAYDAGLSGKAAMQAAAPVAAGTQSVKGLSQSLQTAAAATPGSLVDNVAKAAALSAGENQATKLGRGAYRATLGIDDIVMPGKTTPTTIFSADKLVDEARRIGLKGTPAAMQRQVGTQYNALGTQLGDVLSKNTATTTGSKLISQAQKDIAAKLPVTVEGVPVQQELARSLNQLGKGKVTASALSEFKNSLPVNSAFTKIANGGNLTAKETADLALWKQADSWITQLAPEAKALTTRQSHLYGLAQGLGRMTRTPGEAQGLGQLAIRVASPAARYGENLAGRTLQNIGAKQAALSGKGLGVVNKTVSQVGGRSLISALTGGAPAQDQNLQPQDPMQDPTQGGQMADMGQQAPQQSLYSLEQALMDIQRDPKNTDKYLSVYKTVAAQEKAAGGNNGPNIGKISAQQYQLAQQGQNALNQFTQLIQRDPGVVNRSATPGRGLPVVGGAIANASGTANFDTLGFAAISSLLRAQSGAAVPDSEVRSYMRAYLPRPGDSQQTVATKLQTLHYAFQSVLSGANNQNASGLTAQDLTQGGY